jgi:ribonuclease HII
LAAPGGGRAGASLGGLPDLSEISLARLGEEMGNLRDEEEVVCWAQALLEDRRAGARALGARAQRKVEAVRLDRARVAALFELRARHFARGCRVIAGVDEVGVGPLAGPVVAAAVALPEEVDLPGLDDSKKVSPSDRERLALAIALADRVKVEHFMVDARTIPDIGISQTPLVHGDAIDGSIAAASIVAKVYRDNLLRQLDAEYPGYGLGRNMGYGTPEHMSALARLGASPAHRQSFAPVAAAMGR